MLFVFAAVTRSSLFYKHEEASFVQWMRETNNMFTGDEYQTRFGIWMANKRIFHEHNKKKSFTLTMNHLAHYTPAEYRSLLGYKPNAEPIKIAKVSDYKEPESIDWREKNVVNAVKDQGHCGSCWAFSTIQAMESHWAIYHKQLLTLSEQNLVDCVASCNGCNGGLMSPAYQYVMMKQDGMFMREEDYPYTAKDENCKFDSSKGVTKVTNVNYVNYGDEKDLAKKVAQFGPIAIAIDASQYSFQLYHEGIYDEPACSSYGLNHAVGCVGYGSESGKNYWIVRNSWSEAWGEKGYVRMIKDEDNQCGEATNACFPESN